MGEGQHFCDTPCVSVGVRGNIFVTLPLCWLGGGIFFCDTACVSWGVGWRNPYSFAVRLGGRAGFGDFPVTWRECEADGFALGFQSLC